MSFQNIQLATAPYFLTFCSSDQSLLLFKFNFFVLNTSLFTFYSKTLNKYIQLYAWFQYGRSTELLSQVYIHSKSYRHYYYMLVVRYLLTIMSTQRSNCIGTLWAQHVTKSICSSIKRYIFVVCDEPTHGKNHLPIYPHTHFSSSCFDKSQPTTYKSQHETILAVLNQHTAKTLCLLIILMDNAITHMCIWSFA